MNFSVFVMQFCESMYVHRRCKGGAAADAVKSRHPFQGETGQGVFLGGGGGDAQ